MNREALDEFFARADDVLTDWHGGTDAMHARVPVDDDVAALPGDSYYEQGAPGLGFVLAPGAAEWLSRVYREWGGFSYVWDSDAIAEASRHYS